VTASPVHQGLSGPDWAVAFPDSRRVADLEPAFRSSTLRFFKALHDAGATLNVRATRRPPQQAYLRHWAWAIAIGSHDPRGVPPMRGVDIEWWHGDLRESRRAAQELLEAFQSDQLAVAPALCTKATRGLTLEFGAGWAGKLNVRLAGGSKCQLSSRPRDETNSKLAEVAAGYGVARTGTAWSPRADWTGDD